MNVSVPALLYVENMYNLFSECVILFKNIRLNPHDSDRIDFEHILNNIRDIKFTEDNADVIRRKYAHFRMGLKDGMQEDLITLQKQQYSIIMK